MSCRTWRTCECACWSGPLRCAWPTAGHLWQGCPPRPQTSARLGSCSEGAGVFCRDELRWLRHVGVCLVHSFSVLASCRMKRIWRDAGFVEPIIPRCASAQGAVRLGAHVHRSPSSLGAFVLMAPFVCRTPNRYSENLTNCYDETAPPIVTRKYNGGRLEIARQGWVGVRTPPGGCSAAVM